MKNIIYYISIFLIIIAIFYISSFKGLLSLLIIFFIYGSILYIIYFLYKKIHFFIFASKKENNISNTLNYKGFLINFIKKISLVFIIISIVIGLFSYYQNVYSKAIMSEYTISNGDKTIIFQEMSHIGSQNFYNQIKNNIKKYKQNGFVYFYEGVKPGKKENMKAFNEAIGITFTPDLYKNFSKIYGVTFQDNSIFIGLENNLDYNVDVDIDRIIEQYKQIGNNYTNNCDNKNCNKYKKEIVDLDSKIINTISKLNEKELMIIKYVNKAILGALIKNENIQRIISNNFMNKDLFQIILDGRNKVLFNEINNTKYKKIYITYGKLHFKGLFELLHNNNNNWKIINKKELFFLN